MARFVYLPLALVLAWANPCTVLAFGQTHEEALIHTPDNRAHWYLLSMCFFVDSTMSVSSRYRDEVLNAAGNTVKSTEYKDGELVKVLSRDDKCAKVKIVRTGKSGWTDTTLVGLTPKEQTETTAKATAIRQARDKRIERFAAAQKEYERTESEYEKRVASAISICATLYRDTSDKKVSDLTVKQDEQIKACKTLGLYKP